ncbi:MAG: hypothetical protein KAI27_01730 [Rhodospirillaceae bacterium]|nr:hypothetical protein [Rhodospirillaceae bacterium]
MAIKLYEDGTIIDYTPSPGGRPPGGVLNGKKRKTYQLNGKHKRFIRSSAIRQALTAKYRIMFATLTFPKDINQQEANKCFSNFVDNLQTNFKLHSYVAVKENTKIGRPHFHILLDLPFTDFKILNTAWCSSFRRYMPGSRNAFTTGRDPIIRNVDGVIHYITKYITKAVKSQDGVKPTTRQYFVSQNVHCRPETIPAWMKTYLVHKQGAEHFEGDYFTWYRLFNYTCLPEQIKARADSVAERPQRRKPKKTRKLTGKTDAEQQEIMFNLDEKVDLHFKN